MSTTLTYLTSSAFVVTASTATVSFFAYGAGGEGSSAGNGGSGGAYAVATSSVIQSGSYTVTVGQPVAGGNGAASYFQSASVYFVYAPGGQVNGTVASGSITGSTQHLGGAGGTFLVGYESYNGSGGGASGNQSGSGAKGSGSFATGQSYSEAASFEGSFGPANGGVGFAGGGSGGHAAYYNAGTDAYLAQAQTGSFPGGGGGGAYTAENSTLAPGAPGAAGQVTLVW